MQCAVNVALKEGWEFARVGALLLDSESRTSSREYEVPQQAESRVRRGKEKHDTAQKSAMGNCFTSGQSFPAGPHEGSQLACLLSA